MVCGRGPPPVSKRSGDAMLRWKKDGCGVDFGLLFFQLLSMARDEGQNFRRDSLERIWH